jgi:hypothetical protein
MAGIRAFRRERRTRSPDLDGTAAAAGGGLAQFHPGALDARHLSVLPDNPLGGHEEFHLDALFQGLLDLLRRGGHFRAGPAVEDEDVFRACADGRPDGVHGDVPAADDGDVDTQEHLLAQVRPLQVIDTVDDALHVFPRDVQLAAVDGSAADEDGVKVLLEPGEGKVLAHGPVQVDLDPRSSMTLISAFRTSWGRRYSGIPTASQPPATGRDSKTSTS